jgi:hypothetical protein
MLSPGLSLVLAVSPVSDPPACRGALDAVVDDERRCRSPGALDPEAVVAADAEPEPEAPLRAPTLFPSELGFIATTTAVVGTGAIAASLLSATQQADPAVATLRQGAFWGGVSLVSLAGGIGAAALSTWVFDVSTGRLLLPIFDGEPR